MTGLGEADNQSQVPGLLRTGPPSSGTSIVDDTPRCELKVPVSDVRGPLWFPESRLIITERSTGLP